MEIEVKPKPNIYRLINTYLPLVKKGFRGWWICLGLGLLLGGWYYFKNADIPAKYNASVLFMLEDDISGQGGGAGTVANPMLLAMAGMSGNANKTVIIDLSTSNKLIETTLLKKVKIGNKEQILLNYFLDVFGYRGSWNNDKDLKNFVLKEDYKVGENPRFDYMLRSYSRIIKADMACTVQESGIFKMVYASTDELFTKIFMDNHLQVISDFYILRKVEKSASLVQFATRKRDSIASLLVGRDYGLANVQDNSFGFVKKSVVVPEMQIKRDITILTQQYNEIVAALNNAKLEMERRKPFITVIDDIRTPLDKEVVNPMMRSVFIALLVFVLGIALTLGFYLLRDYLKAQKEDFIKEKA